MLSFLRVVLVALLPFALMSCGGDGASYGSSTWCRTDPGTSHQWRCWARVVDASPDLLPKGVGFVLDPWPQLCDGQKNAYLNFKPAADEAAVAAFHTLADALVEKRPLLVVGTRLEGPQEGHCEAFTLHLISQ